MKRRSNIKRIIPFIFLIFALAAATFFFIPHQLSVHAVVSNEQKQYFGSHDYIMSVSLADALAGKIQLQPAEIKNYKFTGYKKKSGRAEFNGHKLQYVLGDVIVDAYYKPKNFTVTLSDGDNVVQTIKRAYGQEITLPDGSSVAANHPNESFSGWKKSDGEDVTKISAREDKDVSLAASWNGDTYTVTYVLNGGTASNPDKYTFGQGILSFADATRANYIFDGWYTDAGYTRQITSVPPDQSGDLTVYALFHKDSKTDNDQSKADTGAGIKYVWISATNGTQDDINKGRLVQYKQFPNYFAAQPYTVYGKGILSLKAQDKVIINNKTIVIDGEQDIPSSDQTIGDIITKVPGQTDAPVLQTNDESGKIIIKYGHYD